jgi:cell division protein FtsB
MVSSKNRSSIGGIVFMVLAATLGSSFAYAAIRGDFGILQRIQIRSDAAALEVQKAELQAELAGLENLTRRLSDDYLDLDLLDERARAVLGYLRSDEILIR